MREICIIWYLYNVVIKAEIRLVFAILFMTFVRFLVLRNMYYCATAYNMKQQIKNMLYTNQYWEGNLDQICFPSQARNCRIIEVGTCQTDINISDS